MALHAMVGWFVHLSIHPLVHSLANSLIRSFLGLREQPNYKHFWFARSFVCTSVLRSFTPSFFVRSFPYSCVTSFVPSLLFVR